MPLFQVPIHPTRGALCNVRVKSPTRTEELRALIDTGAERSMIDAEQARMLGLQEAGEADVVTPTTGGNAVKQKLRRANLVFVAGRFECVIPNVELVESELINQGFALLLGRDVLNKLTMIWDGGNKHVTVFV